MSACPRCQAPLHPDGGCPTCAQEAGLAPTLAYRPVTPPTSPPPSDRGELAPQLEAARRDPRRSIGKYVLLDELGRGGMGVVWRAWDDRLRRVVAIKTLLSDDPNALKRFQREAEAVARLRHPNIVSIHEVGEHQGRPFLAMDFIDGTTLARRLAEKLSLTRALEVVRDVALAVHHAHEQGVIHRDLKPHNVMIDRRGHPLVMDFGLARVRGGSHSQLTRAGSGMGTLSYMPPEQADGGDVDERADVYSLGATLYHVLTGRPPFQGSDVHVLHALFAKDPLPPSAINRRAAGDLETICLRCLEKDPARRYSSAKELAEDLERHLAGDPIAARPLSRGQRLWRRAKRHKLATAALALAALSALAGLAAFAWQYRATLRAYRQAEEDRARAEEARDAAEVARRDAVQRLALVFLDRARGATLLGQRGQAAVYAAHALAQVDSLPEAERGPLRDRGRAALALARSGFWRHGERRFAEPAAALAIHRPDGRVAWGDFDGRVMLSEPGGGPAIELLAPGGPGQRVTLSFSPQGDLAAIVGSTRDGAPRAIHVWPRGARSGRRLLEGAPVRALDWSPDGRWIAAVGEEPRLHLLEVESGTDRVAPLIPVEVPAEVAAWYAVAWATHAPVLAVAGSDQNVYFAEVNEGRVGPLSPSLRHRTAVQALAWNPGLPILVSADSDGVLHVWELHARGVVHQTRWQDRATQGQGAGVHALDWSPDGCRVVATCYDGSVRVWNALSGGLDDVIPGQAHQAVWTPRAADPAGPGEGGLLLAQGPDGVVELSSELPLARVIYGYGFRSDQSNQISALAWSADGRSLVSGKDGWLKSVDLSTAPTWAASTLGDVPGGSSDPRAATGIAPLGGAVERVFALSTSRGAVWSFAPGRQPERVEVEGILLAGDGARLALAAADGRVSMWTREAGAVSLGVHGSATTVSSLAFLAPERLLSGGADGCIQLFDLGARSCTWRHPPLGARVQLAPAGDGRSFVAISGRRARWFELDGAGQPTVRGERTFDLPLSSCAWSPGPLVALGFEDGRIALWDPRSDAIRAELPGHRGQIRALAWAPPRGDLLASGGADSTVRVWEVGRLLGGSDDNSLEAVETASGWTIPRGSVDAVLRD